MSSATSMYALGLDQLTNIIVNTGATNFFLVEGRMGYAKSALLDMVANQLPTHTPIYFDATTKTAGDAALPFFTKAEEDGYVTMIPHEELGLHLKGPIILMLDEIGKADREIKNTMSRLMYEKKAFGYTLHPDSIVFGTTNLGAEGVGDILQAHQRNRITTLQARGMTNIEWIEWGINNNVNPALLGFTKDNPQVFAHFEDVKSPDDNLYIFHPKVVRKAFCTPRSLHKFSNILNKRHLLDDMSVTAAGIGTVGERAAMDIMAFVKMADQLPTLQSIKDGPHTAKVPTSAAATCMVVYRTLASIEREWLDAWMQYMPRLSAEAQGMFANGVRSKNYNAVRQSMVMTNSRFTAWAAQNAHMFRADV
jgi:hypothetical protein